MRAVYPHGFSPCGGVYKNSNNNEVKLMDLKNYRLYSRGTKSGGAVIKSSGSGGGSVQTSSSGGGSTQTSSSGGGSTVTSASGGGTTATSSNYIEQHIMSGVPENSVGTDNWGYHLHEVVTPGHNHDVTIPNHTHSVTTPNHTHSVGIPAHTHSVPTPEHTHEINIPDHSHDIDYGIFELDRMPTAVVIKVDGNTVPFTQTSGDNIDLIPYLSKDTDGKVNRGWHTVSITPNDLARINAQIFGQYFIQSRGGGSF
jgi:hypothetical protein